MAAHAWVLAVGLVVLGLIPLEMIRQPVADVSATVQGVTAQMRTTLDTPLVPSSAMATTAASIEPIAAYAVKTGDTALTVAAQAGISVDTVMQVNQLPSVSLTPGERLLVPPVDGTLVPIDPNQSLELLAQTFRIDPDVLRKVNGLGPESKLPKALFIPAVSTDAISLAPAGAPVPSPDGQSSTREHLIRFIWPTHGSITQYFWRFHPGLDIANEVGTPELAADDGTVVWAGWGDYGIYVEIDHGNGFHTLYAHMSKALVSKGQQVTKGQLIGLMGATGRATGPHLHFEIRYQGVPQNPLDLLP